MATYDVKEIGYAFLKTYYERMHNDPSKLSYLYSSTAELTHVNYNEPIKHDKDQLNTVRLIGKDNINNFFTRNSKRVQDLKVKIDSCDFQSTGYERSAILILTLGELYWTDSPSYRFCQCFILEPVEYNGKVYDLKNDIIRFIPDLGVLENVAAPVAAPVAAASEQKPVTVKKEVKPEVKAEAKTEAKVEPKIEVKTEAKIEPKADAKVDLAVPAAAPVVVKAESKPVEFVKPTPAPSSSAPTSTPASAPTTASVPVEKKADTEVPPVATNKAKSKPEEPAVEEVAQPVATPSSAVSVEPRSNSVPVQETAEKEATPKAEPVKMTWAGKLNKTPKLTTNYIKVDIPQKKSKSPPPNGFTKTNKKTKQQTKPIGDVIIQNSSGFFPVYVGNTNGLTASELETALIKEYGDVVKTSFQDSFAVVDFREKSARDAAIDAQHLKVGERFINLNPKGDKTSKYKTKNHNNPGSSSGSNNSNTNSNSSITNNNTTNGNAAYTHVSSHNSPSPSSELSLNQNNYSFKKRSLKSRNDKSKS
ncbi:unnamed protein product [Kluyveromyces dobzhanskii CBS 2104]|uniref:WGS project CCBQ000000000 data, contig 00009 n=1 Tax=Kluyveromyces dobzhanskii CBS 2104 TaxID=1427455 RepID=A0A0A8L5B0_9SACH|nr:unnamed protein product [Kluyveromyces dobzhanskii CBS 2104]